MNPTKTEIVLLRTEYDILNVCYVVRKIMIKLKFRLLEQTKMVTAASELGRNTLIYGGGGSALVEQWDENLFKKVRISFEDKGQGIIDLEKALSNGFTTGSGLGLGLGGAKRLVHQFQINSKVGEGTKVIIAMQHP